MTLIKYARPRQIATIDEVFKTFLNDFSEEPSVWRPAINVVEKDKSMIVTYALPGFSKEEIRITVEKNILTVKAEHEKLENEENNDYLMHEISGGVSVRRLELPDTINHNKIDAHFENGLLILTLGKKEEEIAKEISININ